MFQRGKFTRIDPEPRSCGNLATFVQLSDIYFFKLGSGTRDRKGKIIDSGKCARSGGDKLALQSSDFLIGRLYENSAKVLIEF